MVGWLAWSIASAVPVQVPWQARLLGPSGAPLEGPQTITISLFDGRDFPSVRWSDTFEVVAEDGYVSVVLGSGAPLDAHSFATFETWIEARVAGQLLGPRFQLMAVPYAAVAESVRFVNGLSSLSCQGEGGRLVFDHSIGSLRVCDGSNWVAVGVQTIVSTGGARRWSDGSAAASCDGYRRPSGGRLYQNEGDGLYFIDPDGTGPLPEVKVLCDQTTDGGGWTLVANRRTGNNNVESCGGNLAAFFTAGCGTIDAIGPNDSYALSAAVRAALPRRGLLVTQLTGGVLDADDAYFLEFDSATDPFPNTTATTHLPAARVCNLTRSSCDNTSVFWKYQGSLWFHSADCNSGTGTGSYGGNYGVCHNGASANGSASTYPASSFTGNRQDYGETKLWDLDSTAESFQERLWIR
jgi:hypothetical protein